MYKLLLCWRYLLTRRLALACIISVMLGVATLIVVNAVMSGFSTKLKDRLHDVLSDVVVNTDATNGFDVVRESTRDLTTEEREKYRGAQPGTEVARYRTPHALVVERTDGKA